mmetsp:Transcript_17499/g.41180  ORF Transcript_17499/g.41180 Transcript_17499/m.41180 type:complete len:235 (-) Transcript_17499:275-979(-)
MGDSHDDGGRVGELGASTAAGLSQEKTWRTSARCGSAACAGRACRCPPLSTTSEPQSVSPPSRGVFAGLGGAKTVRVSSGPVPPTRCCPLRTQQRQPSRKRKIRGRAPPLSTSSSCLCRPSTSVPCAVAPCAEARSPAPRWLRTLRVAAGVQVTCGKSITARHRRCGCHPGTQSRPTCSALTAPGGSATTMTWSPQSGTCPRVTLRCRHRQSQVKSLAAPSAACWAPGGVFGGT